MSVCGFSLIEGCRIQVFLFDFLGPRKIKNHFYVCEHFKYNYVGFVNTESIGAIDCGENREGKEWQDHQLYLKVSC